MSETDSGGAQLSPEDQQALDEFLAKYRPPEPLAPAGAESHVPFVDLDAGRTVVTYDPVTGEILSADKGSDLDASLARLAAGDVPVLDLRGVVADFRTHYIELATLLPLPVGPSTAALNQATWTITGIPSPCYVGINGERFLVEDGSAELEFPGPGHYLVEVISGPQSRASFEVTYHG